MLKCYSLWTINACWSHAASGVRGGNIPLLVCLSAVDMDNAEWMKRYGDFAGWFNYMQRKGLM